MMEKMPNAMRQLKETVLYHLEQMAGHSMRQTASSSCLLSFEVTQIAGNHMCSCQTEEWKQLTKRSQEKKTALVACLQNVSNDGDDEGDDGGLSSLSQVAMSTHPYYRCFYSCLMLS